MDADVDGGRQTTDGRNGLGLPSAVRRLPSHHVVPVIVILIIAGALFVPAIVHHEVFTFRDHTDYFQPLRWYTAESLRQWQLPLWNPYNASGEPWLANPQSGVFYPPTWLFIFMPFAAAYMSYLLLHLALLGVNAYVLFTRSATRGAALAGAVALMLCGPTISLFDVNNNLATFAWVPLAIWCGLERRPRLGGVVLAMAFLGGEPFFAAVAALLFVLAVLCGDGRPRLSEVRQAGAPVLHAAFIALGLSAIQLIPFIELLRESDRRAGFDPQIIFRHSMRVGEWLRVVIPPGPLDLDLTLSQQFIPVLYVGVATVVLALAGLTVPRRAWPWLLLLAASVVVAAGDRLPFGALIARAPLTLFRYPARVVPFGALAIIALAVIGIDRIPKRRVWVDIAIVTLLAADLVPRTVLLRIVGPLRTDRVPYAAAIGENLKIIRIGEMSKERDGWIGGYLNLYAKRFDAGTAAPVTSQAYMSALNHDITGVGIAHLNAVGVGWVLTDRVMPADNYVLVARAWSVGAWRSLRAKPMARVIEREGTFHRVESMTLGASSAVVNVDTPRGGLVVLTQRNAPGWNVLVDGQKAIPFVYDRFYRAVPVRPGKHVISWIFRPFSLIAGACVTLLTIVAMLVAVALQTFSVKR